jgi:PAB-dependent poly(A)-specific ribonuclease subunit 3
VPFSQADLLENELQRELENARLVRLLAKFGFINERPECVLSPMRGAQSGQRLISPVPCLRYDHDPRWAETGDRYIIKLFRDYLFHQISEHGRPVIDLSHVLTCLNKLDAGVDEQIALVSRDEQSCLIVSYREVKNCLENSFRELAR